MLFLRKYFPGAQIKTAYEAGFSGFVLHRYLTQNGVENIVVNAASIEVASRDRVKTDKRDAVKIAKQLSSGFLKGICFISWGMNTRNQSWYLVTQTERPKKPL